MTELDLYHLESKNHLTTMYNNLRSQVKVNDAVRFAITMKI